VRPPLLVAVAGSLLTPLVVMAPSIAGASGTHAPVRTPDVIGLSRAQTYAAMRNANLFFSTSGPGSANSTWTRVVGERPAPGTVVAWHSSVALIVTRLASATAPALTTKLATASKVTSKIPGRVPNLSHMTRAQVYAVMHRADLYFSTTGPGSTTGTWKSVVAESPAPGTPISPHSSVTLTTSLLGPVPAGHVRVPNLTHLARAQVFTVMRHADLYFTTRGGVAGHPWTRVVAESPAPGSVVALRSTITLTTATATAGVSTAAVTRTRSATVVHSTAAPLVGSTQYRIGVATWYSYIPGQCATSYLPMGTRITVEDLDTGVSVSCVVTDRQDYSPGRVVDLNETQFSQLTALWRGVVRVKVSW
jgi:beta-lactam-binding protein with PASTA domain